MTSPRLPARDLAVARDGTVVHGLYEDDFQDINLLDARALGFAPRPLRRFRLKAWQHFGAITATHWISVAVVNARHMNVSWCYVFDRRTGQLVEHKRSALPGTVRVPDQHFDGRCEARLPGYRVELHNHLAENRHVLTVDIAAHKGVPAMKGELVLHEDRKAILPLIPLLDMGAGRLFYTHKVPCPLEGWFEIGGERIELTATRDVGLLDIHKAYYPARTLWNWATFAAFDPSGRLYGVNLTEGTAFPRGRQNENAIWDGPTLSSLAAATFEIPEDPLKPWRISTEDGRAELRFVPEGQRAESIRLGPIISEYHQPFGRFSGTLLTDDGRRIEVDAFGCAEKHIATW